MIASKISSIVYVSIFFLMFKVTSCNGQSDIKKDSLNYESNLVNKEFWPDSSNFFLNTFRNDILRKSESYNRDSLKFNESHYFEKGFISIYYDYYGEMIVGFELLLDQSAIKVELDDEFRISESSGTMLNCADIETKYFDDGSVYVENRMKNGLRQGFQNVYFQNQNLASSCVFVNDTMQGLFLQYRRNGTLKSRTSIVNGRKEGMKLVYNEDNEVVKFEEYSDDKLILSSERSSKQYSRRKVKRVWGFINLL